MAIQSMNVRIRLNGDTEANWEKSNFIPMANEMIVYEADTEHPAPRIKIGNGYDTVSNLPFIAGSVNLDNIVAAKVAHKLTFGDGGVYQYDGSEDVTVPVYTGNIELS